MCSMAKVCINFVLTVYSHYLFFSLFSISMFFLAIVIYMFSYCSDHCTSEQLCRIFVKPLFSIASSFMMIIIIIIVLLLLPS